MTSFSDTSSLKSFLNPSSPSLTLKNAASPIDMILHERFRQRMTVPKVPFIPNMLRISLLISLEVPRELDLDPFIECVRSYERHVDGA